MWSHRAAFCAKSTNLRCAKAAQKWSFYDHKEFLLIDIRHAPSENDRIMYDWIRRNGYDPIIIATKLDKINRSQIQKQVKLIRTTLQAGADTQIIPYSAQTKQGREEIYEILDGVLAAEAPAQE